MADKMCELLIEEGFIVQRYDAYSTESIYLKLDYGMCNSIRISNHEGKKHLSYMYNLRSDIRKFKVTTDNFTRYYYPFNQYKELIYNIKFNKGKKIKKAGNRESYDDLMNIEKSLNKNNKGFWQQAYLVNKKQGGIKNGF